MSRPLHPLTTEALALDPADRLRLPSERIDRVEGDADPAWSERWTAELQRRSAKADAREARDEPRGAAWSEVKRRLLKDMTDR